MDEGKKAQPPKVRYALWVNVLTREIKTAEIGNVLPKSPWFDVSVLANPSCRKCYGCGKKGFDIGNQFMEPCGCTQKNLADKLTKVRLENSLLDVQSRPVVALDPTQPVDQKQVITKETADAQAISFAAGIKKRGSWLRRLWQALIKKR